ncbi:hypothetical protein ABT024_36935 [Streptomyces sp. NPDC002812]|uniref:hypothetical protein n=1 Tax=Streptomyces sp. NPDC002812 TaxID=3154434 RepID=UPI0033284236
MRRTIPINRQWIATALGDSLINDPATTIPVGWEKTPALRDIALLPQSAVTGAYTNGTNATTSDVLWGLLRIRTR